MTKIKFCGLRREEDIEAVNELRPDYIGFVFAEKSKRFITRERAAELKRLLSSGIPAVGVFVDAPVDTAAGLLNDGIIDMAQLHGHEDEAYITALRERTDRQIIRAFRVRGREDIPHAEASQADLILLDAGAGDGKTFEWDLAESVRRPYFLAGGLTAENAEAAINRLHPFALDVSSGIETNGVKDKEKMRAFLRAVRGTEA